MPGRRRGNQLASAVILVVVLLCAGCGADKGPIDVSRPAGAGSPQCARLIAALPHRVNDQTRVATTGTGYAAAWGDPAIVLRCGVGIPAGYTQTSGCSTVNGIDWFMPPGQVSDNGSEVVFTTLFRIPGIEVVIPAHYRPQGPSNVLVDITAAVRAHTTAHQHCA